MARKDRSSVLYVLSNRTEGHRINILVAWEALFQSVTNERVIEVTSTTI